MLSKNIAYIDPVRRQVDNLFAAARVENGQVLLPHYYGEGQDGKVGWYGYRQGEFFPTGALGNLSETTIELYLWSLDPADVTRILPNPPDRRSVQGWIEFLQGRRPNYPVEAMQQEREAVARIAERASKNASGYGASPVAFESLANLTLGAANLYGSGDVLRSQVRFFDPERRRAGLSQDVAALVEKIERDSVTLTLINTSASTPRRLIVQMGAYGEHQALVRASGRSDHPGECAALRSPACRGRRGAARHRDETAGERSHASVSVGAVVCCLGHDRQASRLMLVDDDKHSREGYQLYLSGKGFRVHTFDGGVDALAFAKSSAPDLVVLDLGLPDVDGWEVARRLKSDAHTKDIPIIAFSGRSMHHEQVSALRAGCDVLSHQALCARSPARRHPEAARIGRATNQPSPIQVRIRSSRYLVSCRVRRTGVPQLPELTPSGRP